MRSFNEVQRPAVYAPLVVFQKRRIHHDRRIRKREISGHFLVYLVVVICLPKFVILFMPPIHGLIVEVPNAPRNIVSLHLYSNEFPILEIKKRIVVIEVVKLVIYDLAIELT